MKSNPGMPPPSNGRLGDLRYASLMDAARAMLVLDDESDSAVGNELHAAGRATLRRVRGLASRVMAYAAAPTVGVEKDSRPV